MEAINLEILFNAEWNDRLPMLLGNGRVQSTNLYKLASPSVSGGGAFMVRIDKTVAQTPEEAIVYQLQRLLEHSELLSVSTPYPKGKEFLELLQQQQVLTGTAGRVGDPREAGLFYETLENEARAAGGDYLLNDEPAGDTEILGMDKILSALVFVDKWNEKTYLLETADDWWWLSWGL